MCGSISVAIDQIDPLLSKCAPTSVGTTLLALFPVLEGGTKCAGCYFSGTCCRTVASVSARASPFSCVHVESYLFTSNPPMLLDDDAEGCAVSGGEKMVACEFLTFALGAGGVLGNGGGRGEGSMSVHV